MKKASFLTVFMLFAAISSFSQSRSIYFEGNAPNADQQAFFLDNFKMQAPAGGCTVANSRGEAAYSFRFVVKPNVIVWDDGTEEPAPPEEPQFIITITFIRNEGNAELASFDFPFNTIEEMNNYTLFLFLQASVYIPPPVLPEGYSSFEELAAAAGSGGAAPLSPTAGVNGMPAEEGREQVNNEWLNKWLYFRFSVGFPITFYKLMPKGLIGGIGVYNGDEDSPSSTAPLDNRIIAAPNITMGFELRFFKAMSAELNFQAGLERLNSRNFFNMAAGLEIKFPFKFVDNVALAPYGILVYPVRFKSADGIPEDNPLSYFSTADIYNSYPKFGYGGGLEININAGSGAAFIDFNYIYFGDTKMNNELKDLYPNPEEILYKRYSIGIAIGYKFGFFSKGPKAPKEPRAPRAPRAPKETVPEETAEIAVDEEE